MIKSAADFILGVWNAPEVPLRIEYPLELMEELRAQVFDELQRLSRGGTDAAGVLFGINRGPSARILAWRPIWRSSAEEQPATSATHDRAELVRVLSAAATDPEMRSLEPLGWFISRFQGGTGLTAQEVELFDNFFPSPSQFTLLLRRGPGGIARAGFFVREAGGFLRRDASYRELLIQPLRRVPPTPASTPLLSVPSIEQVSRHVPEPVPASSSIDETAARDAKEPRVPPESAVNGQRGAEPTIPLPLSAISESAPVSPPVPLREPPPVEAAQEVAPVQKPTQPLPQPRALFPIETPKPTAIRPSKRETPETPTDETPSFLLQSHSFGGSRWLWALPIVLALGVVVFLATQKTAQNPAIPFSLRVASAGQMVEISWDRDSIPAWKGDHASIKVQDGPDTKQISLNSDELRSGKTHYIRETGDVGLLMTIYDSSGREFHEFARLVAVGPEPAPAAESPGSNQLRSERDGLQSQVQQLKEQVRKEAARADQAEGVVKILENRLKIRPDDEKK